MPEPRAPLATEPIDGRQAVENYDRYAGRFMSPEYRLTAALVQRLGFKKGRVLDIGTGSGRLAVALAARPGTQYQMVALDISTGMLSYARRQPAAGGMNWVQASAAHLPFEDGAFDVVMSYASLHHWQQPGPVFNEIWRVVKPGGLLVVRDNRRMLGNPFYRACVWALCWLTPAAERGRWTRSLQASYTLPEVRQILHGSDIPEYALKADMLGFDLRLTARKS
jgi:ubiquinone/menaquinone biosynthesis C-methylase UbiE